MSALCAGSGLLMPVESRASKVVFLETSCGENHTEPRRVLVAYASMHGSGRALRPSGIAGQFFQMHLDSHQCGRRDP